MRLSGILAVALLTVATAGAALADPSATSTNSTASTDVAERVQLARQLYDLSGGRAAVEQQIGAMFANANKIIASSMPPDAARFGVAIQRYMQDEFLSLAPIMIDDGVQAYADNLTIQELRDYAAWLSSDSGRAIIRKSPAIRQEIMDREAPRLAALIPGLQHKISDRVCAELHCTTKERETVDAAMARALPADKG